MGQACAHLTTGGVSNEWYGAGEGRCVHSSESAPSHCLSAAFSPLERAFRMMYRNYSCDRPKPNAPIEEILFHVSKISG